MFGLFKAKEINKELLVENVANTVIDVWIDKDSLKYEKFATNSFFRTQMALNESTVERFFREKLRIVCSVALLVTSKNADDDWSQQTLEALSDQILQRVKGIIKDEGISEPKGAELGLSIKAKEYAKQRFSTGAKEAGQWLENTFATEVFREVPSESNIDARYLLYKQLSSFEQSAIFRIGDAIRRSRE